LTFLILKNLPFTDIEEILSFLLKPRLCHFLKWNKHGYRRKHTIYELYVQIWQINLFTWFWLNYRLIVKKHITAIVVHRIDVTLGEIVGFLLKPGKCHFLKNGPYEILEENRRFIIFFFSKPCESKRHISALRSKPPIRYSLRLPAHTLFTPS